MTSVTLCDMAHGYSGGNGDWPPPRRRDSRDPSAARGTGRRRPPEQPSDGFNGFAERKPPLPPEPPGARNGMMARPRGVNEPPPRSPAPPPPPGARRRSPAPTAPTAQPAPPPPAPMPPRNGRGDYSRLAPDRIAASPMPPISPAPRPQPGRGRPPGPPMPPQPMRRAPGPQGLQAPMRPMPRPRPAAPGRRWQRVSLNPHLSRRWKASLTAIAVILVLSICGIGSYLMVLDERKGVQAQANTAAPKPTSTPVDISSRAVDPVPLTEAELFPTKTIVIDEKRPNEVYTLIDAQELTKCEAATAGEITTLIAGMGCTQVVRGTLTTPASGYVVTGGVMNLDTAANAEKAWEQIKTMVEGQRGRFVGYVIPSNKDTKPLALASSVVGWTVKGHYVAYCVIARTDSEEIPKDDMFAQQIMEDIVQLYLKNRILEARASDPVVDPESPAASASATP